LKLPMTFTIVPEDELEGVELPRRLWVSINRQGGVKLRMPAAGTTFPVAYTFLGQLDDISAVRPRIDWANPIPDESAQVVVERALACAASHQ